MEHFLIPFDAKPLPAANHILVLAPHPDDEVFGCGGALTLHAASGAKINIVIATAGECGGRPELRLQESTRAATVLGYPPPVCWHYPDRGLVYGEKLIQEIVDYLHQHTIDLLYAPSLWENHPDHRALALAAMEACRRCEHVILLAYEVGAALRPNFLLDISAVFTKKQQAMECFSSQLEEQAYDQHIHALNIFRTYTLPKTIQAAEGFERYTHTELKNYEIRFLNSEYQKQYKKQLLPLLPQPPKISVLIRSLNRSTLSTALDSLAAQTYSNIEIIVVNASGKEHIRLGKYCGQFPLRLIDNSSTNSLHRSHAANLALANAQGEYVLFLDDDDWLAANHLARLASILEQKPDYGVVYTGAQLVNADGGFLGYFQHHPDIHNFLLFENVIPIHTALFRRKLAQNCQFDELFDIYEDWDFWLQLSRQTKFYYLVGDSAYYRIVENYSHPVHDIEQQQYALEKIFNKWHPRWEFTDFLEIRNQIKQVNSSLQQQEAKYFNIKTNNDQLKQYIKQLEDQLLNMKKAQEQQEKIIEAVYQSRSWRYTHWFRLFIKKIQTWLK